LLFAFAPSGCDDGTPSSQPETWYAAEFDPADTAQPPTCAATCEAFQDCVVGGGVVGSCAATNVCPGGTTPCETTMMAAARHAEVAARRAGQRIIVHRGSWAFAEENTAEAMRATFELGADGNEIDIRRTADGVLVLFHDDMLESHLQAFGNVADFDWDEIRGMAFRDPGPFGEHTRIPTLVEALDLHRRHAGLLHLDIKVLDVDDDIIELLDAMDLWDHVTACGLNGPTCTAIIEHPSFQGLGGMVGLIDQRGDFDYARVAATIPTVGPTGGYFVDDPRTVLLQLGRPIGEPSSTPVRDTLWVPAPPAPATEQELVAILSDDDDWNTIPITPAEQAVKAAAILARAEAALAIAQHGYDSAIVRNVLTQRVLGRSLHPDWRFHGLDSTEALSTLFEVVGSGPCELAAADVAAAIPGCPHDLARYWIEHEGADLEPLEPLTPFPPSDWRIKWRSWERLADFPHEHSEAIALDYLALDEDDAAARGLLTYQDATRTLLAVQPRGESLQDQMDALLLGLDAVHAKRRDVAGRAILELLTRRDQYWARTAVRLGAEWTEDLP
ncbi:MAG: glycerophosphodiester phosphodiesterase family protein, partial [Deltaproteobacteria bacterium]|nr:glycerophosphodiester phosphodiesterase family protein [Deltaproteobacteria bacterium]